MEQRTLKRLAVISLISFMTLLLHSQVTIGASEEPVKGALLDLKDQIPDTDNVTSETGGLVLARVKLENLNTLEPFIETTDADWINNATTKIKEHHTGLIVYNLTDNPAHTDPNKRFTPGLYLWDGAKWSVTTISAANGLNIDNTTVKLGGNLNQEATNIGINAATQALKFDITNNSSNVNRGVLIPGLQEQGNSKVVVADINTGKLGIATVVPAGLAFYQASSIQQNISADINAGNMIPATFVTGDMVYNNIVTLYNSGATNYYFEFKQTGKYEISATVCYCPKNSTIGTCLLNAYLQIDKGSGWQNYSAVRGIWSTNANVYRQTMIIPPVLLEAQAGEKIRLTIQRPPNTGGSGWLGDDHSNGNASVDTGILVPYGTQFSKTIKILAVEM